MIHLLKHYGKNNIFSFASCNMKTFLLFINKHSSLLEKTEGTQEEEPSILVEQPWGHLKWLFKLHACEDRHLVLFAVQVKWKQEVFFSVLSYRLATLMSKASGLVCFIKGNCTFFFFLKEFIFHPTSIDSSNWNDWNKMYISHCRI